MGMKGMKLTDLATNALETYRKMLIVRGVEERIQNLFGEGIIGGTCHLCIGQEAAAVGMAEALAEGDQVVSCHRGHGHLLAVGGEPDRLFGELMGKETGYCRGRGGSQHMSAPELGFLGTNGITAGGIPLATGAALSAKCQDAGRVVVCCFGDGATSQGTFHESLNMASLWKLPVLFFCENNGYAMSTPVSKTVAGGNLCRRAAAYAMPASSVNGMDVDTVRTAVAEALAYIRAGNGPAFIEARTYRFCGHSKSDRLVYRTREEETEWHRRDPLKTFRARLVEAGLDKEADRVGSETAASLDAAVARAQAAPETPPETALRGVYAQPASPPRILSQVLSRAREMYGSEAIADALDRSMARDPSVILMGEDIGAYGGAFGVTRGLLDKYGAERVIETPISENSFVGVGVGAAMTGLRPVVEIMFMDFILLAADQIINHAAKLHYVYDGKVNVPLVVRTPAGAGRGYGASHSQNLETVFASFPGLKIVAPSNPADAKGLLAAAIRDPNPVLFVEPKSLYGMRGEVAEDYFEIPLGKARVAREGGDATILCYGGGVQVALNAAVELAEGGIESEVVDLRTLKPLDRETVFASVRKTGRCIIFEEGHLTGGVGAEIVAEIVENCFPDLKAAVRRVALKDVPIPSALNLERAVLPTEEGIYAAVERLFE